MAAFLWSLVGACSNHNQARSRHDDSGADVPSHGDAVAQIPSGSGGTSSSVGSDLDAPSSGGGKGGAAGELAGGDGAVDIGRLSAIDFSRWALQLPIGNTGAPTTIAPAQLIAGFANPYFYQAADGGQVFMDPATGITTSGSQHCRTELREMANDTTPAAWPSSGTNTLTVTGKVVQVGGGTSGHVTIGQVFVSEDSIPLCELEYSNRLGGFELLYEEASGAGSYVDLKTPVALGATYTYTLALSSGSLVVAVDGQEVYRRTPSAAIAAKTFYFKCGNYDQTATVGTISTTPYTVIESYGVSVVHQ